MTTHTECGCGGDAELVRKRSEATLGGARPGEIGTTVEIDDEYYHCPMCKEDFYTAGQSQQHSERLRLAVDALRWRKLVGCARIRVHGWAELGTSFGHMGLDLWGRHDHMSPDLVRVSNDNKVLLTKLVDAFDSPEAK